MNQALFERFLIDDREDVTGTFAKPFDLLMEAAGRDAIQTFSQRGLRNTTRPGLRASWFEY